MTYHNDRRTCANLGCTVDYHHTHDHMINEHGMVTMFAKHRIESARPDDPRFEYVVQRDHAQYRWIPGGGLTGEHIPAEKMQRIIASAYGRF